MTEERKKRARTGLTVDRLKTDQEEQEKLQAILEEEAQEYSKALNGVAASEYGQFFLKRLIRGCGVFSSKETNDTVALIKMNAKAAVYLEFIRPYLEPDIRKELEN